ncbi:MAG: ATP-binding protein [Pyrinomonadaceae bacterium MAG19_C2-C3]|nr:ATP-binding protein [Pyrinomonadaceae bacterium MAG19_C2-C3]
MSLRIRLWLLTAFAVGALIACMFVAWRLARTTETFTLRQAEASLRVATANLASRVLNTPAESDIVTAPPVSRPPQPPRAMRPKQPSPMLPHEREIFARYPDALRRTTALALHRTPEVAGGLVRADGELAGVVTPFKVAADAESAALDLSVSERELIAGLTRRAIASGDTETRTVNDNQNTTLVEAYPLRRLASDASSDASNDVPNDTPNDTSNSLASANPIVAVWTLRRLSGMSGANDMTNIIALAALLAAVAGVAALALTTMRDLRHGVTTIQDGLTVLSKDLYADVSPPRPPELARIANSVNALADALRRNVEERQKLEREVRRGERLAALGRVVAGVAHEVRNPLAAMRLKLQTTERAGFPADKLPRTFAVVVEEIDRLDKLVRRLLELGNPPALVLAKMDLCDLARGRLSLFAEVAARQNVTLKNQTEDHAIHVEADAARLAQVLDNLIRNALDAMPDGGTLTVTCETDREASSVVRLTVKDTGKGITDEAREHIFEPFYTRRAEGTGLGLAIAREIVEAHHGAIYLESETEAETFACGATFIITLPLASSSPDTENQT